MSYLKLIKLLYWVDRSALLEWGRPVTTDNYASMPHGPVVSRIYNLITEGVRPGEEGPWHRHISEPKNYEVSLLSDPGTDELSEAEEQLIDRIFAEHGKKSRWELRDQSHSLPEWEDPDGSALPIEYHDILIRNGKTAIEAKVVEDELEGLALAQMFLR